MNATYRLHNETMRDARNGQMRVLRDSKGIESISIATILFISELLRCYLSGLTSIKVLDKAAGHGQILLDLLDLAVLGCYN
jgi:hypothetical protein